MFKTFKLVGLSLLTVGMLAGCNKSSSSPTWSKDDKTYFDEYLYGEVLPYASGFGKLTVAYDSDYNYVVVTGEKCSSKTLESYSEKFNDYEGGLAEGYDNVYLFEKAVETESGTRYVSVQFNSVDEEGYIDDSGDGIFTILANDPYLYEFPTEFFEEQAGYYYSKDVAPEVEADHYYVDSSNSCVLCYFDSEEADGGYSDVLSAANWDVKNYLDVYDYYIANSPDGLYCVSYLYSEVAGALAIYFENPKFDNYPSDAISSIFALYEEYGAVDFGVPAPSIANPSYFEAYEDGWNALYAAFDMPEYLNGIVNAYGATEQDYSNYQDDLEAAEWTLVESDYSGYEAYKIVDYVKYSFEFDYDGGLGVLNINFYLVGTKMPRPNWPGASISSSLPVYVEDVIPEYTGENNGFLIDGWRVDVKVDDPSTAMTEYAALLTSETEGWTLDSDGVTYVGPNGHLYVYLNENDAGDGFYISYQLAKIEASSCTNYVRSMLGDFGIENPENVAPDLVIEGQTWSLQYNYSYLGCSFSTEVALDLESVSSYFSTYCQELESLGFVENPDYSLASDYDIEYVNDTLGVTANPYIYQPGETNEYYFSVIFYVEPVE